MTSYLRLTRRAYRILSFIKKAKRPVTTQEIKTHLESFSLYPLPTTAADRSLRTLRQHKLIRRTSLGVYAPTETLTEKEETNGTS